MAVLFTQFSEHELREIISDAVRKQLQSLFSNKKHEMQDEELLTINQVCKIFNVSRQTLLQWRKKGLLESITQNRRVYFLKNRLYENLQRKNRTLGEGL